MIGQTLSHFRVTAKLGEGGMGEVYRAEDTKLGRDVALKVLPEAFAQDSQRMARFAREAQMLAALNHANIASIYGVEEAGDRRALVMELIEGETLGERIGRGRLPVEETIRIALQIAEALEAAHDKGIIHRDLKPANVKITPEGQVKVLDFGLAKALEEERPSGDIGASPTLTAAATQAGIILGTAAYMSPEQAAGSLSDRRSDIWSFGVVIAEMLTGRQQFQGQTVSHVLAAVLKDQPDWDSFPSDVPPRIVDLVQRCLRKEAKQRVQSIGDVRVLLEEYVADPEAFRVSVAASSAAAEPVSTWKRFAPWTVAALLAVGLAGTLWALWPSPTRTDPPRRLSIELPAQQSLFGGFGSSTVLSPDGTLLAYVFYDDARNDLHIRSLSQWEGTELVSGFGNDRPYQPFFSPDGQWVGFVTPTSLNKVPVSGGTPITLCDVQLARGATWSDDGTIIFTKDPGSGLFQVPPSGGEPIPLTELDEALNESSHRWPQALPGGEAVLFTVRHKTEDMFDASIELVVLDTGERKLLHRGGTYGRYVPSGHMVYANRGTLFALPFDLATFEITGGAAPVVQGVTSSGTEGSAQYGFSNDGTLIYAPGTGRAPEYTLMWVDRQGKSEPLWEDRQDFRDPRFSPDGRILAIGVVTDGTSDIWVLDLERDVPTRLTFHEGNDSGPVWTPDGRYVLFSSDREGSFDIYRKRADGSGDAERLTDMEQDEFVWSTSPDGKVLAYTVDSPETFSDLWLLPEDGEPEPFLVTPAIEVAPVFSPDGLWIAYFTNESGNWNVFVRGVDGSGKWQISSDGGAWPLWSRDGKELFFFWAGGLSRATIDAGPEGFRAGRPEEISREQWASQLQAMPYAVEPNGERFVTLLGEASMDPDHHEHLSLVLNWFDELERTFATSP